jgi:hypothetical protein
MQEGDTVKMWELNSSTLVTHSGTAQELFAIRHDNAKGRKKSRGYLDQKHATRIHCDGPRQREIQRRL